MALASVAAASGAAAYLDAKFHFSKDIGSLREQRRVRKVAERKAKENRRSLWYVFEEQALRWKDRPCLWYRFNPTKPVITYSWTEAYHQTFRYAQFFLDNGVQPGELLASYLQNSPEFLFTLMGSWCAGSATAMINCNLAGDALVHSLKVSQCKLLIVDADTDCQQRIHDIRDQIDALGLKIIVLDAETKAKIAAYDPRRPDDALRSGVTGDFPIFLFYTSGTTGFPKACPFPTQRAYGLGTSNLRTMGLKPGEDTWYDCMPLYHGTGCTVAIGCMFSGITLAIGRKFSVRNFWIDVHDSEANAFVYVGETARYLLAAPPSPHDRDHKLKAMFGNGMRPDVWLKFQERFNVPVVNEFFNSTEGMLAMLNVCRGPFHQAHVGHHGLIQRWLNHNIIIPVEIDYDKNDAIWRDPHTGFAKRKQYEDGGEIIIACESVKQFVGYWKNAEATAKRFERDVFRKGDLFYRTGDALRRDRDGRWYFMDRLGDTFRWKSENVSTAEVAEVLGRFPGVVEANVYGVEVPGHDGRAGCAAVYLRPDERRTFDYPGMLRHARAGLPRYAVPLFIRLIKSPTPMHNNKQNKVPLRKEGIDPNKIATGDAGPEDVLLWLQPEAQTYVPFTEQDFQGLTGGKVRL